MTGEYRLLIFDGHESHTTYEFISYCEKKKIIPFCLPPHSKHVLQPLDVTLFSTYKYYHAEAVDEAARTGYVEFTWVEFLHVLHSIRGKRKKSIKKGFRDTGLFHMILRLY
jgi:hypothetical protein